MNTNILRTLILGIFIFQACEYEPTGIYERTTDQNILPPEIQTVILNIDSDSIYIYTDREVSFRFNSSNQEIIAIKFILDNEEEEVINSNYGTYLINYENLTEGTHTLTVEIYTESGTESIADNLGIEGFVFSNTWTIIVVENSNATIQTNIINGILNLSWTEYTESDFKEYIIYNSGTNEYISINTPEYIDNTYVGRDRYYRVQVKTQINALINWGNISLDEDFPKLSFSVSNNNEYKFYWEKPKYYNAVDTVIFYQRIGFGNYERVKTSQNPEDTTYITNALFGDRVYGKLFIIPKNSSDLYYYQNYDAFFVSYITGEIGYRYSTAFSTNNYINQVNGDEFVYLLDDDSLMRFSVSKRKVTQKFGYQLTDCYSNYFRGIEFSPSGNFLISLFTIGCDNKVLITNSSNLEDYTIHNLEYFTGSYLSTIPISDIGTGIVSVSNNGFYIYDFNTEDTLAHYTDGWNGAREISPNGDYFILINDSLRLVEFKDSTLKNIWSESRWLDSYFIEFDASNPVQVNYWDGSIFSVKSCSDFSTIYEFSLTYSDVLNIDYINDEILCFNNGSLYIHNLNDGSLIKEIPLNFDPTVIDACYLINHTIVSNNGLIYFIN